MSTLITKENYKQEIDKYRSGDFPEQFQKSHEVLIKSIELDFKPYYDIAAIKSTIDNYLIKLNEYVILQQKKRDKTGPNQASVTDLIKQNKNVMVVKPAAHLEEHENVAEDAADAKTQKRKKQKKGSLVTEPQSDHYTQKVERLTDGVRLIQRYVALHRKNKSPIQLIPLIRAIQKAMVERLVRKKSVMGEIVLKMQDSLLKIYNSSSNKTVPQFLQIEEKSLSEYVSFAGGEQVFKSIGLIKRFIGMQAKDRDPEKLERFLKSIKKTVLEDDPYQEEVESIQSSIEYALQMKRPLAFSRQELHGLDCIAKDCSCKDSSMGTIYQRPVKNTRRCISGKFSDADAGACSYHKGLKNKALGEVMSLKSAVSKQYETIPFSGKWHTFFGDQAVGMRMMIYGEPFSGKSSLLLEFAHYLAAEHGDVLYCTSEEYDSKMMQKKLRMLPSQPDGFHIVNNLDNVDISKFKFVFLDSVNDMELKYTDFKALTEKYPKVGFIYAIQSNKDGSYMGGKRWEHRADVVGYISNYTIKVSKNRLGKLGEYSFYDPSKQSE